jgi:parallel beta-helix repeat protein
MSCLVFARFSQPETRASSGLPVHNLSTGLNYTSIQAAIDANETLDGQTILVDEGTYYENVVVDKSLSLVGENVNTTIVDGGGLDTIVNVAVDGVNVSGLTIQNSGSQWLHDFGVDLTSRRNCRIDGCIIRNQGYSIYAAFAQNNTISNNLITNASSYPIMIQSDAGNNFVVNNTISGCSEGVHIEDSSDGNVIANNIISYIGAEGIYVLSSSSNVIVNNEISSSGQGGIGYVAITLMYSSNNTVANNVIQNCTGGVQAHSITNDNVAMYDVVENNIIMNCDYGILLIHEDGFVPTYHQVIGNTIENNGYGLYLVGVENNTVIHNNFINNSNGQVVAENLPNAWDDGYPSGGNFWSDYNGTDMFSGTFQNVSSSDGIGDSAYVACAGNVTDRYPLMAMFCDFNATPQSQVQTVCNSTISDFQFNGTAISFNATGENGTTGFCRISIPTALINGTFTVFVNGTETPFTLLPESDSTQSYLYFTYHHSTQQVVVAPEFPSFPILTLFLTLTLLAFSLPKVKKSSAQQQKKPTRGWRA